MKILFIGGTGIISTAVSKLAIEKGLELFHFNRGLREELFTEGVKQITGDINNFDEMIFDFANHNEISIKEALLYVFCHETVHLADVMQEKTTERIVGDFFSELEEEDKAFQKLKNVAYSRSEEVR